MAKAKTVSGVEIKAERVVSALVDRLIANEKRLDAMQKELNEHMEIIAELQPKLIDGDQVTLRAMRASEDSTEEFTVTVAPTFVKPITEGDRNA